MNTQDQANAYTGHAKNGSPIQKHSQSDFYARYKIIMVFMPLRSTWVAMVGDKIITVGKGYEIVLGAAVIRVIAAPAMGGLPVAAPLTLGEIRKGKLPAELTVKPGAPGKVDYAITYTGHGYQVFDVATGARGYSRLTRNEAEQDVVALRIRNMMHS